MELAAGLIGVVVGAGVAVGVACLERRWRRQDVRAAEKRARLEERFERVLLYAAGKQEFVLEAVVRMGVWEKVRQSEGRQVVAERMLGEIDEAWRRAEELKPRPGPYIVLRDVQAQAGLQGLELVAEGCRYRCAICLGAEGELRTGELAEWIGDAEECMVVLRGRTQELVEEVDK